MTSLRRKRIKFRRWVRRHPGKGARAFYAAQVRRCSAMWGEVERSVTASDTQRARANPYPRWSNAVLPQEEQEPLSTLSEILVKTLNKKIKQMKEEGKL